MRSVWRTLEPGLLRDVAALAGAIAFVGASFGAIATSSGNPVWVPVLMSLLVFAGGAQFMAIGVASAGGGTVAAVLAGLLLNLRMLPFGMAIANALGRRRITRLIGGHLVTDETTAFALARSGDPLRSRQAFWVCGLVLYAVWNVSVLVGAVGSRALGNPDAFGIDAAFPAALLALVLPALRDGRVRRAALVGAAIAVLTTPLFPPGIPVLLALTGLLAMLLPVPKSARGSARDAVGGGRR